MKNTWRRTIAFALIVCALLSVMVPSISAAETPVVDNESETYNLMANIVNNYLYHWSYADDRASLAEAYDNGTLRWKYEMGSGYANRTTGSVYMNVNLGGANRLAFRFKSPGNGTYSVKIRHAARAEGSASGAFWILPYTAYSDHAALKSATPANTALGTMNCKADSLTSTWTPAGYYEFEAGKEYLLVLGKTDTNTENRIYPMSFAVNKVAAVIDGNAYHTTLEAAITAAESTGGEIDLLRDYETASVDVPAGVTLDLNGKKLTADVIGQGKLTDSSAAAGVVISDKAPTCGVNADELLLKTTNGYQIFDYTLTESDPVKAEDGKSVNFWFDVRFADAQATAAYTAIATGDSGFDLTVGLSWEEGDPLPVRFDDGKSVADWASLMLQNPEYSFYIRVEGLDSVTTAGTLKAAPKIVGLQGSSTVEMTYEIAAQ